MRGVSLEASVADAGAGGSPGVSGSPGANKPGVSGSPGAGSPGVSGSPGAGSPGVSGSPGANKPGASGSPGAATANGEALFYPLFRSAACGMAAWFVRRMLQNADVHAAFLGGSCCGATLSGCLIHSSWLTLSSW